MTLASTSMVPLPGSVPAASAPARAAAAGAGVVAAAVRVDARDPTAATIGAAVRGGRRLVGRSRRRVRLLFGSLGRLGGRLLRLAVALRGAEAFLDAGPTRPASAASTSGPEPETERTGAAASPRSSGQEPGGTSTTISEPSASRTVRVSEAANAATPVTRAAPIAATRATE